MRTSANPAPESVLVVDDEPSLRAIMSFIVQRTGAIPVQAPDAATARQLAAKHSFACALIDKNLPGENGLDFLKWLRSVQPGCNALIVTAYGNVDSAVEALRLGAFDYLLKPFEVDALAHRIKLALEQYRMRQERERMQAMLIQADRLASLGLLAAGVVHEVNTPLAYILSNLDWLDEELPALRKGLERQGPEQRALAERLETVESTLRDIREGAERVRHIARDVKAFARDPGDASMLVDLREVLEAALKMALVHIRYRARVVRDYQEVPMVMANEPRLAQVFLNLVVNAAQAIPEDGAEHEIRVRLWTGPNGEACAEVGDTGLGIPPENMANLFEPFFTTKSEGEGTGLGLFICKSILESFGGTITVDSRPGEGTTFRLTLPPHASASRAVSPLEPVSAAVS
ncbi:response regulator [Archangium violaceum]|uniref:sensor histidine kinase n=1 Tax=Archangium violaceum TaxID=83451 RepID=UPI00193C03BD|nr:ATP-binding protein [Archangium violaceum]QRK07056.1 response regulator [Archangium violaceum]